LLAGAQHRGRRRLLRAGVWRRWRRRAAWRCRLPPACDALARGQASRRAALRRAAARPPAACGTCRCRLAEVPGLSAEQKDIAALAKGGRTNFFGFLLRLAARIPFLFIAGPALWRGRPRPVRLGDRSRSSSAAQLATLGQKRGLAQQLARDDRESALMWWPMRCSCRAASRDAVCGAALSSFPQPMFPSGQLHPAAALAAAHGGAAGAGRYRAGRAGLPVRCGRHAVRARSVVEPWTLSLVAGIWLAAL